MGIILFPRKSSLRILTGWGAELIRASPPLAPLSARHQDYIDQLICCAPMGNMRVRYRRQSVYSLPSPQIRESPPAAQRPGRAGRW